MFIACLCFTTTSDATPAQACIDNFDEVVVALLNNGADVNSVDSELWTPLHAACTCGNTNIANILVERFVQVCVCVCVCVCALAFVYAFEISILEILNFTKKTNIFVPAFHCSPFTFTANVRLCTPTLLLLVFALVAFFAMFFLCVLMKRLLHRLVRSR